MVVVWAETGRQVDFRAFVDHLSDIYLLLDGLLQLSSYKKNVYGLVLGSANFVVSVLKGIQLQIGPLL